MARRFGVNKGASAGKFKKHVQHTKAVNLPRQVMRGGWRL
jgi:hypothetical protein